MLWVEGHQWLHSPNIVQLHYFVCSLEIAWNGALGYTEGPIRSKNKPVSYVLPQKSSGIRQISISLTSIVYQFGKEDLTYLKKTPYLPPYLPRVGLKAFGVSSIARSCLAMSGSYEYSCFRSLATPHRGIPSFHRTWKTNWTHGWKGMVQPHRGSSLSLILKGLLPICKAFWL